MKTEQIIAPICSGQYFFTIASRESMNGVHMAIVTPADASAAFGVTVRSKPFPAFVMPRQRTLLIHKNAITCEPSNITSFWIQTNCSRCSSGGVIPART